MWVLFNCVWLPPMFSKFFRVDHLSGGGKMIDWKQLRCDSPCLVVWGRIAAACLLRWWGTRLISMKGATWQGPKKRSCWLLTFLRNLRLARDFPFLFLTTNMATIAGYVFKTHVIIFIYSLPPVLSDLLTILHHKRRTTCSQFLSHELSSISKVVNHCHRSIHCRSPFGTTPLSLACHAKHIEEVEVIS